MTIALDATYSIDPHPSGIAVYSRELLNGLAAAHPEENFFHCYRFRQFFAAQQPQCPNVRRKFLIPPILNIRASLFHALNQRLDRRPANRVISTFHDLFVLTSEYSSADFRARFARQARQAAANSDMIIAVSEFTANQVHALLGVPRSKIRVVHHGVRLPDTRSEAQRENLVLFVGALQVRKNVARLVEAFERMPSTWRLTLAGAANGFGAAGIMDRIQSSSARERIKVTGYVPAAELEALYARASIFAFPSLDEGFGMPVLDAMARGIPVVTSNRSALPEVAGDAALLVQPDQSEEIAAALTRLAEDVSLREKLAEAGRARAKRFSWRLAVEQTYGVYQELLS